MPHSKEKLIVDIIQACDEILEFCEGKNYGDFSKNRLLQAGVERELEIVGEALNRLYQLTPDWLEKNIPECRRIIGVSNVIAHGYDAVDYDILWDLAQNHIPALREKAENLKE